MKITRKTDKTVPIHQIKVGQTFIEDNEIFLMCHYDGDDIICPRCSEDISINEEIAYLAVMLSTGELFNFHPYDSVTLVECEVVEIWEQQVLYEELTI